jgi:uncharacterized protein (TIGR02453 family)
MPAMPTSKKAPAKKASAKKAAAAAVPSVSRFEGFAGEDMKFFKSLARHQDRAWFAAHKSEYEEGWAKPMAALMAEAAERLDAAYPTLELAPPKVFRIHRDVRFSADKSPYKTSVSGVLVAKHGSKVTETPSVLYVQLGLESYVGAGLYMMPPPTLAKYRAALLDNARGGELAKLVRALEQRGFVASAAEELKAAPRGIDPAHPRLDLLKKKGLVVGFPPIPAGSIGKRAFLDWVVEEAKRAAALVTWLAFETL